MHVSWEEPVLEVALRIMGFLQRKEMGPMTDSVTLWMAFKEYLPKRTWIPIADVFAVVQDHVHLDAEDLEPTNVLSDTPRWKSNVRRLLRKKKHSGSLRARKST